MDKKTLVKFLKEAVENARTDKDDVTYRLNLDDDLAVYVGWGGGFDAKDETTIHAKDNPEYCLCVKIAENGYYLWDDAYMPWYTDDGEVYDTDTSLPVNPNYEEEAESLLYYYDIIREGLDSGELTFD